MNGQLNDEDEEEEEVTMKRQQVISRFFAAKPSAGTSSASTQNAPPSGVSPQLPTPGPLRTAAPASDWPRGKGRKRALKSESLPDSFWEKSASDAVSNPGSILSSDRIGEAEGILQSHSRLKRSRVVKSASSSWEDGSDGTLDMHGLQVGGAVEATGCESDPEGLPTEQNQSRDFEELGCPVESSETDLCPRRDADYSKNCVNAFGGTSLDAAVDAQQLKSRPVGDYKSRAEIPASDPVKHKLFAEKLLARIDENGEVKKPWYGSPPTGREKLTPLEAQVVELKNKYPDVMLMVEVGYRYRFFGDDAEMAGRILRIFPHYDHNFLTASIPTFRLHFHVRRLVAAGLKVGVVRQTETAAIKAHGANKTGPFTRGLSALYTRATIEAAEDLGGGGGTEGKPSRLSSYLMCVAERPIHTGKTTVRRHATLLGGNEATELVRDVGCKSGSYDTEFGVVAVETATGDVMFGNFKDTVVRTGLESRLITCAPAELLLATPLSATTDKVCRGRGNRNLILAGVLNFRPVRMDVVATSCLSVKALPFFLVSLSDLLMRNTI